MSRSPANRLDRLRRARRIVIVPVVTAAVIVFGGVLCRADLVTLRSGGVVRGRVSEPRYSSLAKSKAPSKTKKPSQGAREPKRVEPGTLTLTTLTGGRVVLDAAQVAEISHRPMLVEDFEVRARHTPEEIEPLLRLANWCRDKGLKAQREETLRRVLAIDPDHLQAHQGLGEARYDGKWKTYDEEMRSRGFVKFEGRYVALKEVEILKKLHSRKRADRDWFDRVRGWARGLTSGDPDKRRRGGTQLLAISDPDAIPALNKVLRTSDDEEIRSLYVKILSRIPGPEPVPFLVEQSLFDVSKAVRTDAQEAIVTLRPESAPGFYANGLRNADNDIVRRSGMMLEKIGNRSVIPALIEAVVTTHQVPMTVVDNSNTYGFSSGPGKHQADTMGLPPDVATRILTGQYPNGVTVNPDPVMGGPRLKTVMVPRDFRNAEVLAALETLTQQNLGYDKDQWRRWWAARETIGGPATNTAGGGAGSGGGGSAAGGGTGPVIGSGPKGSASSSSSKTH